MIWLLGTLFFIVCLLLVFMVVITPSNEGGMAAAFGGMGGDTFFGTRAGQTINKFTVGLAVTFLVLAVAINWVNSRQADVTSTKGRLEEKMEKAGEPAPAADPAAPKTLPPGATPTTPQ